MTKITKAETVTRTRTDGHGNKIETNYRYEYLGDRIKINLALNLDEIYPDFEMSGEYDTDACKDYLVNRLINFLRNNKEKVKEHMSISDFYFIGYNVLEGNCWIEDSEE